MTICNLSTYAIYTLFLIVFFVFARWVDMEIRHGYMVTNIRQKCIICGGSFFIGINAPYGSDFDGGFVCGSCFYQHLDEAIAEAIETK